MKLKNHFAGLLILLGIIETARIAAGKFAVAGHFRFSSSHSLRSFPSQTFILTATRS
jgi:hypothetical protein